VKSYLFVFKLWQRCICTNNNKVSKNVKTDLGKDLAKLNLPLLGNGSDVIVPVYETCGISICDFGASSHTFLPSQC
jgi:hypothetical protein